MKNKQPEKMYIGVFSAIVLIACVSILVRFFTQEVLVDTLHIDNGVTRAILFDMQSEDVTDDAALEDNQNGALDAFYISDDPADETAAADTAASSAAAAETANQSADSTETYITKFENAASYFKTGVTNWATDNIAAYKFWVGVATGYNKALRWGVTPRDGYNSVVFLSDGYLTTFISAQDMTEKVDSLLDLKTLADDLDIDFLYVQYPFKICEADPESGTLDFSNQNADQKLGMLRENDVSVLDLREAWQEDGGDNSAAYHRSAFYITDHHWRAETGLWAAGTIAGYLNESFGFQIDLSVYAPDRYRYDLYEARFLGSYGRQATLALTEPEDFTLVYPNFKTSFDFPLLNAVRNAQLTEEQQQTLEALYEKERALNGSFEMFFDYSMLEPGDYYNKDTYCTYTDSVNDLVYIHNNLVTNGEKVLFLRDSYGRTCVPFFALGVENTLRIRPDSFGGSWQAYLEAEQPDVVVVLEG